MTPENKSKFKKVIETFNTLYDVLARIIKIFLFIIVIVILFWRFPYIDWNSTSRAIVSQNSPIKFENPVNEIPLKISNNNHTEQPSNKIDYLNIMQFGQIIFSVDKPYDITSETIIFDKLLLKGRPDYDKPFLYGEVEIKIIKINEYIGMLVSGSAVQGPLLRGVHCEIIRN